MSIEKIAFVDDGGSDINVTGPGLTPGSNPDPKGLSSFPTTLADLTFHSHLDTDGRGCNSNKAAIYGTIATLRKATLSIPNRLRSVLRDAEFVEALFNHLNEHCPLASALVDAQDPSATWPVIPNERSGSWLLDPKLKASSQAPYFSNPLAPSVSAYFKSTDGHINQWSFSTRRLNLPVLELLGRAGAAVLVDTTRRGKSYPDALRRTVPIWCAVWNQALFSDRVEADVCNFQGFRLDQSEVAQISARIPRFVEELQGLGLDMSELKTKAKRPISCIWVNQPSAKVQWEFTFTDLIGRIESDRGISSVNAEVSILICCSASKQVMGTEMSEEGYIQGAGDDSEGWSHGLTASLFWQHKDALMNAIDDGEDMDMLVRRLVREDKTRSQNGAATQIQPTSNLFLAAGTEISEQFALIIDCNQQAVAPAKHDEESKVLSLGCKDGKAGSKQLRDKLSKVKEQVEAQLAKSPDASICVCCSTGQDLSVGVVLVILCCFYDDEGNVTLSQSRHVDKQLNKQRLAWITSSKPDANPSRATLQAVNSFLMARPA